MIGDVLLVLARRPVAFVVLADRLQRPGSAARHEQEIECGLGRPPLADRTSSDRACGPSAVLATRSKIVPLRMSTRLAAQRLASVVIFGARISAGDGALVGDRDGEAARRPVGGNEGAVPKPKAEFERHRADESASAAPGSSVFSVPHLPRQPRRLSLRRLSRRARTIVAGAARSASASPAARGVEHSPLIVRSASIEDGHERNSIRAASAERPRRDPRAGARRLCDRPAVPALAARLHRRIRSGRCCVADVRQGVWQAMRWSRCARGRATARLYSIAVDPRAGGAGSAAR